jgi:hypothetical protein
VELERRWLGMIPTPTTREERERACKYTLNEIARLEPEVERLEMNVNMLEECVDRGSALCPGARSARSDLAKVKFDYRRLRDHLIIAKNGYREDRCAELGL